MYILETSWKRTCSIQTEERCGSTFRF